MRNFFVILKAFVWPAFLQKCLLFLQTKHLIILKGEDLCSYSGPDTFCDLCLFHRTVKSFKCMRKYFFLNVEMKKLQRI